MLLRTKTGGRVPDDKSAAVSQFANITEEGPLWRLEHKMRTCTLLGWDTSTGLDCDAIDTTYRMSNADCAKILFDSDGAYRASGTYSDPVYYALEIAVHNEMWVSPDGDVYAQPTDLAVVILPCTGAGTKYTFLLVPDFMVRNLVICLLWTRGARRHVVS